MNTQADEMLFHMGYLSGKGASRRTDTFLSTGKALTIGKREAAPAMRV